MLVFVRFLCQNFSFYFVLVFCVTIILVLVFLKRRPIILVFVLIFVTKITLLLTLMLCNLHPQIRKEVITSGVTMWALWGGGGRTAPGDTLQGRWHPNEKSCGWIYKELWTNEVRQIKKVRDDTLQRGDTGVKSKKVTMMSKKGCQFLHEKIGVTPSVAAPGDINPNDATAYNTLIISTLVTTCFQVGVWRSQPKSACGFRVQNPSDADLSRDYNYHLLWLLRFNLVT